MENERVRPVGLFAVTPTALVTLFAVFGDGRCVKLGLYFRVHVLGLAVCRRVIIYNDVNVAGNNLVSAVYKAYIVIFVVIGFVY